MNKKIKLAIVSRGFLPDTISGRETVIYHLWKIAKQYYDVTLICGWKRNADLLPGDCCKINISHKNKVVNYFKFYTACKRYIKEISPDLILANSIEIPKIDIPTAMIIHDLNFGQSCYGNKTHLLKKLIIAQKLKNIDKIATVSNVTREKILRLGIDSKKINVILNGVDIEKFCPADIQNKKITIVYPSRILHGKGQHIAIEAIKLLRPEIRDNIYLNIVGYIYDKEYYKKIQGLSEGLPINFETDVADIAPYYQQADIVIYPTIMEEGFGYTAVEGMACGKPVIYSDFPAIIEAAGNIGIKFKRGVASELAKGIEKLYFDKKLCSAIGKEGRNYVLSHYRWEHVFKNYQIIFNELLASKIME